MLFAPRGVASPKRLWGNGGAEMKHPLESLHTTIGLGVILTAIMVLIMALFYWESSEPVAAAKPATDAAGSATQEGASTTGGDAATGTTGGDAAGTDAGSTQTNN